MKCCGFLFLGQAEEGTDEVYAQVSLVPESEVSFVQILCFFFFLLPIKCREQG